MPTYEYLCTKCGNEFEKFQSISSEPVTACEKCGAESRRLISGGQGIIFKGSGFYVNDYKKDSGRKVTAKNESSTEPVTEAKAETNTEAKSETPKDSTAAGSSATSTTTAPAPAASSAGTGSSATPAAK